MTPNNLLSSRLWIAEGFLDTSNWLWNDNALQTGLNWFAERKLFVPCSSIWNFDTGKLVIPSVFIEYNLLETVIKSHNQATKVVRRKRSELGKIRTLPAITSFSKDFFKKMYFNVRAVEIYRTLCKVLEKRVKKILYP